MKKVGMISLGCPKNQVDGEIMLAALADAGYEITGSVEGADCVIVNTCGFIDDAKREAIDTILEVAELKKAGLVGSLLVTGCLAQRYKDEVIREMPEIDGIIGIGENANIVNVVDRVLSGKTVCAFSDKKLLPLSGSRLLSTPDFWAYLKIADGCSNCCTYCAIPSIRGGYRSREEDDIVAEAESLVENGVKEIVLIAQDVTKYGIDLYGELRLPKLLKKLCKIDGIRWIRLLYCYPDVFTDELIELMASEEKICNYVDLPLQHADSGVLKRMNRKGNAESYMELINKLRSKMPDVVIRTTFIAGFPGETEDEFETLCSFIEKAEFDRLGCFAYSPEEGTPAAKMDGQIEDEIKARRADIIMGLQYPIFERKQKAKTGKTFTVIVDGYDEEDMLYYGRTYGDCAEIDSRVIISTEDELIPGEFVDVKIIGTDDIDLVGEVEG